MEKVTAPKSERKLPNYVDDTTMDFALDTFIPEAKDFNGRKKNMIVLALYHTGMRRAELINLKDSDVDFGQGTLKVLGKRNKERIIPFSGELKRKLSEYIEEKNTLYNSEYVFVTTKGKKMYPKFVYNTVNSFLKQASVSGKKSPHVLRHSFATNLLNKGADLNAIKELLGHSNLSATQIYTQNSIEKLKNIHKLTHPKSRS
jgi:integrase/recombinase XerC